MRTEYLFVYGTLRSDANSVWHDRLIAPFFTLVGTGKTAGRMYSLGEYPGLVECQDNITQVEGEIYSFDADVASLEELDEYEGCDAFTPQPHEYRRTQAWVTLDNGDEMYAWCYYYLGDVSALEPLGGWPPPVDYRSSR